jgi:polar amino acid transport system ATP-binding protein
MWYYMYSFAGIMQIPQPAILWRIRQGGPQAGGSCGPHLCAELLASCYPGREDIDLNLSVSHAELDNITQIDISCGGAHYNPFEQKEDNLGVTILKKMSRKLNYRRTDSENQISIIL